MEFPPIFLERTAEILGNEMNEFISSLQDNAPVSIRLNDKHPLLNPSSQHVSWCDQAFYLAERPLFTADPLLHAGAYYVQEASSMFLQYLLKCHAPSPETVLDLCAAPGGKSTLISQHISNDALLVSNEINRSRAMILSENLIKWGNPNVVVTNNLPADFRRLPAFFDVMVVDAPCSGEGMFRKDPGAIREWSLQNVQNCAIRQKDILEDAWNCLKTNGIILYSTCTFNREENEEIVEWICEQLGAELLNCDISAFEGITNSGSGYRFYPHLTKGEGFFIAAMRKTSETTANVKVKTDKKKQSIVTAELFDQYLKDAASYDFLESENIITAHRKKWLTYELYLKNNFNCLTNGIQLAERKGKDLIPAHQLALSKQINLERFEKVELDRQTALQFLKRENIVLSEASKGYLLITYEQLPLGWVKNLGNRSNNLYPQHWRIRMNLT